MESIIKEMIEYVDKTHNYEVAGMINKLLSEMEYTCNCPSNWKNLGEELAKEYVGNDWVMDNCKLYKYT